MSTSGVGDRDPGVRADFRAAVEACAARLRQSGVEPANFGPSAVIGDIEDFRRAIGVDSWLTGGSYGTMSRMLAGYLALHPDRAQIAFFDSPASPTLDPLTAGALGLDSALLALDRHNPGLLKAWKRALTTTGRKPLAANRGSVAIVVDDAKLVRLIRFALGGDGPRNVRYVPRMIAAAANGRLDPHLLSLAVNDPPFCAGYIPLCQNRPQYSLGAFLTDFCEQLPSDRAALERAIAGRPAYRKVFGESPYQEACAIWRVPSAPAKAAAPSLTPALLLTGEYDSFSRPEWAHAWAKQFRPASWSVSIPGQTHNVLGSSDCAIAVRNAWRNNPGRLPDNTCANTRK